MEQGAQREPLEDRHPQSGGKAGSAGSKHGPPRLMVDWAMRYGNPSVKSVLDRLVAASCRRLLLDDGYYPRYPAPTTATAYDKAFDALKAMRWQPALRTMGPYYDQPRFIAALADSIRTHLAGLDWEPDLVVLAHGMPKRLLLSGDPAALPYPKQTRLVREQLGWSDDPDDGLVPVALRQRRMAAALPRQDGGRASARRSGVKKVARRGRARLYRRLPRDARGDRRRES